jgi:hypothetical protein
VKLLREEEVDCTRPEEVSVEVEVRRSVDRQGCSSLSLMQRDRNLDERSSVVVKEMTDNDSA